MDQVRKSESYRIFFILEFCITDTVGVNGPLEFVCNRDLGSI